MVCLRALAVPAGCQLRVDGSMLCRTGHNAETQDAPTDMGASPPTGHRSLAIQARPHMHDPFCITQASFPSPFHTSNWGSALVVLQSDWPAAVEVVEGIPTYHVDTSAMHAVLSGQTLYVPPDIAAIYFQHGRKATPPPPAPAPAPAPVSSFFPRLSSPLAGCV